MRIVATWPAEADIAEAFKYYEAASQGLGDDFLQEYRKGIERILGHPRGWRRMNRIHRRYLLHRFPYGILYRVDEKAGEITVVAVMHMHAHPQSWRKRIR